MDLLLDLGQERIPFSSLLTGAYNVYNVQTALEIGFHFGVDMKKAAQAVADYLPENMRSQWKETEKNKLIIDAYNANPTSLEHALIHLSKITEGDTLAIVGEMREMGEYSAEEHGRMVELLTELGLAAILVGKEFEPWKMAFPYFETVDTLISWMANNPVEHKTILIKGSRGIQLERVIPCL
jgi:UDP-N-acetylmuramoyl-tripeptide--D-alanyl-D-alanine ligase